MCIGQWYDVWGRKRTCRSLKECSLASRAWGTSWKRSGWIRLYSSRSTFFSTGGSVGACWEAKARVPQAVCAFCSLRVVRAGTKANSARLQSLAEGLQGPPTGRT